MYIIWFLNVINIYDPVPIPGFLQGHPFSQPTSGKVCRNRSTCQAPSKSWRKRRKPVVLPNWLVKKPWLIVINSD